MTKQDKIERMIEFLTERHLDECGGYPLDYDDSTFSGHVIIADLDESKERARTEVKIYLKPDLVKWHNRANKFLEENPDEDFNTACWKTES